MKRKRDYMFLRPGSKFWQLKLQSPDGRTEQSLRTTDRAAKRLVWSCLDADAHALTSWPTVESTRSIATSVGRSTIPPWATVAVTRKENARS